MITVVDKGKGGLGYTNLNYTFIIISLSHLLSYFQKILLFLHVLLRKKVTTLVLSMNTRLLAALQMQIQ